jgi:hypothetical protein
MKIFCLKNKNTFKAGNYYELECDNFYHVFFDDDTPISKYFTIEKAEIRKFKIKIFLDENRRNSTTNL